MVRVISGLPLGATDLLQPVAMMNLLGEPGYQGQPLIEGLVEALAIPGLSFHFYDKENTYPFRKMGHITVLDTDIHQAVAKIHQAKHCLKIKGSTHL